MKIHHIGLAVNSIDEAAQYWKQLGFKIEHREIVRSQSVEVAFLSLGNVWLEFIQPAAEETPITNFLKKRGEGLHHICLEVDDIKKETGCVKLITGPVKGFGDSTIAFAYPREFGKVLVEFVQDPPYWSRGAAVSAGCAGTTLDR
jgi:methylmalonyl-CoA epimerase